MKNDGIVVEKISKSFAEQVVLKDISFRINPGERVSLTGPGGSGKSTIFKIILGLIKPDTGKVSVMGTEIFHASEEERIATLKKVGVAFQQGALFDFMTVWDNLSFAIHHMMKMTEAEKDKVIKSLLAQVKLPHTENMFPSELSGGMQRRVGIARALATNPQVAFFDEPTAGLDPVTSTIVLNMIHELCEGKDDTIQLIATSNVEIALRFAHRVIVINEGVVVADGDWRELLLNSSDWVKHFLSVRLIGLDKEYVQEMGLPEKFIAAHW